MLARTRLETALWFFLAAALAGCASKFDARAAANEERGFLLVLDRAEPLSPAHATNVAAVALGVAPAARVAALDVFGGPRAFAGEILAAIDWAIENQGALNIAALNLSLGAGAHPAPCGDDAISVALGW